MNYILENTDRILLKMINDFKNCTNRCILVGGKDHGKRLLTTPTKDIECISLNRFGFSANEEFISDSYYYKTFFPQNKTNISFYLLKELSYKKGENLVNEILIKEKNE